MEIRNARRDDMPELMKIYEGARRFMRAFGNPTQWVNGYPAEELLLSDIAGDNLYVGTQEGEILCVFAMFGGEDPTYRKIDGAWVNDRPYLTIHRIASSGKKAKVADEVFAWAWKILPNLRIDTHEDNLPMQNCLKRNGFVYCGTIYLENGDPRRAYQKSE